MGKEAPDKLNYPGLLIYVQGIQEDERLVNVTNFKEEIIYVWNNRLDRLAKRP